MEPGWLDMKRAAAYLCLSVRTLRRYIGHPTHPLPVHVVGGKWLVSPADLDAWVRRFPKVGDAEERMADEVMRALAIQPPRPKSPRTRR